MGALFMQVLCDGACGVVFLSAIYLREGVTYGEFHVHGAIDGFGSGV